MEVYIHDQREKFTILFPFGSIAIALFNNTITRLFIRPEVIQRQNKPEEPCTLVEDYSYMRVSPSLKTPDWESRWQKPLEFFRFFPIFCIKQCMENCFWKKFQSDPDLPCIISFLTTNETELKKSQCENRDAESDFIDRLLEAQREARKMRSQDCNCPKRCNQIDYQISADPTRACQMTYGTLESGRAVLIVSFPSQKVRNHSFSNIIIFFFIR